MWTSRPSWWIYIGDANVLQLELRPAIRRATWNMLLGKIRIKISKKTTSATTTPLFLFFCWMAFIQPRHLCRISTLVYRCLCYWLCYAFVDLYLVYLWDAVTVYVIDCVTHLLVYIIFICEMQLLFIDVGDAVAKVTCIIGPPVTRWLPKQTIAS